MNFLEKILAEKAIEVENMPLEEVNQVRHDLHFMKRLKRIQKKSIYSVKLNELLHQKGILIPKSIF